MLVPPSPCSPARRPARLGKTRGAGGRPLGWSGRGGRGVGGACGDLALEVVGGAAPGDDLGAGPDRGAVPGGVGTGGDLVPGASGRGVEPGAGGDPVAGGTDVVLSGARDGIGPDRADGSRIGPRLGGQVQDAADGAAVV